MRSGGTFRFNIDCIFCGKSTESEQFKKSKVRTFECQEKLNEICQKRKDSWSDTVSARIEFVHDLHAADVKYHQECSVHFRTGRQIPSMFATGDTDVASNSSKRQQYGRPSNLDRDTTFKRVTQYLQENDEEHITINDLITKMEEYLKGTDVESYSFPHMKQKLIHTFGNSIIIAKINVKQNVVTFKTTPYAALHNFHSLPKSDDLQTEKKRLIKTAAKLLKNDIKFCNANQPYYPRYEEMASVHEGKDFLPQSFSSNSICRK